MKTSPTFNAIMFVVVLLASLCGLALLGVWWFLEGIEIFTSYLK